MSVDQPTLNSTERRMPGAVPGAVTGAGTSLDGVIEDLEQQASGQHLVDRDDEVDALQQATYADIDLASRLHGEALEPQSGVRVRLVGGTQFRGRVTRVGADFALIEVSGSKAGVQWAVLTEAIATVAGLGPRAMVAEALPLQAKLGIRSVLRELVEQWCDCTILLRDGAQMHGRPVRVGADFAEFSDPAGSGTGSSFLVPWSALAGVRLR